MKEIKRLLTLLSMTALLAGMMTVTASAALADDYSSPSAVPTLG